MDYGAYPSDSGGASERTEDGVVPTAEDADPVGAGVRTVGGGTAAAKLGLQAGHVVQELGWDEDCDEELRAGVEAITGSALLDEDHDGVVDVVLLWYRDGDGDLVDALVDAIGPLAESGLVWLLTPKLGRDGHVESADISDAAPTAGLSATSTVSASRDWQGTRLVAPRTRR